MKSGERIYDNHLYNREEDNGFLKVHNEKGVQRGMRYICTYTTTQNLA